MKYVVQEGETLEMIAKRELGDEALVQYLASINSLPSVPTVDGTGYVYLVSPGQEIETGVASIEGKVNLTWLWLIVVAIAIAVFIGWRFS